MIIKTRQINEYTSGNVTRKGENERKDKEMQVKITCPLKSPENPYQTHRAKNKTSEIMYE